MNIAMKEIYNFPVRIIEFGYNEQDVRPTMQPHSHYTMEFNYVVAGEAELCYQKSPNDPPRYIKMFPNDFVLIKPHIIHSINSDKSLKYFVVDLGLEDEDEDFIKFLQQSKYVNSFASAVELLNRWKDVLFFKDNQNIPDILYKFKYFNEKQMPDFYNAMLEIRVKQLFLAVIQCRSEEKKLGGQIIHIKRAMSFLQSNYHKNITVQDVADYTNLSSTHIQRVFKEIFEMAVMEKLNEIRIQKAVRLLMDSSRSIKKIAEMTGFNSIQAFEFNFKKIHGKSPSAYKKTELSQIVRFTSLDKLSKLY